MKKLLLFLLVITIVFSGCSLAGKKENGDKLSYNYPPPLNGLIWGMDKNEVIKILNLNEKDVEWQESKGIDHFGNGKAGTDKFFRIEDPITFLGEEITATVSFYEDIGLSYISMQLNDTSDTNIVEVQRKLQDKYESSWGTILQDLSKEQKNKLKEFFLEHGTPEKTIDTLLRDISDDVKGDKAREIPLVSYSIETNLNSPAYGSINFTGYFAAMLEHSV